jgi:hypothetical protein
LIYLDRTQGSFSRKLGEAVFARDNWRRDEQEDHGSEDGEDSHYREKSLFAEFADELASEEECDQTGETVDAEENAVVPPYVLFIGALRDVEGLTHPKRSCS